MDQENNAAITRNAFHKKCAVDCFNSCWTLIEKTERTADDIYEMIRLSEVSFWHWSQFDAVQPTNLSISNWQLSRVYLLASEGAKSLFYGEMSLKIGIDHSLPPFYMGYAYEAIAKAQQLLNQDFSTTLENAMTAAGEVEDKSSKEMLLDDLRVIRVE